MSDTGVIPDSPGGTVNTTTEQTDSDSWSFDYWLLDQMVMQAEDANRAESQIARLRWLRDHIDALLAALCLHDHPFGFTWADVDRLLDVAKAVDYEWGFSKRGEHPDCINLTDIAARIAALLPPRPTHP